MKTRKSFVVAGCLCAVLFAGTARAEESIPVLYEESYALEVKGDYNGALNRASKILRLDIKDYTAHLRAGWLFYMMGKFGDSVSYYEKASDLRPNSLEPLLGQTLPLMAAKKWGDAEKTAIRVVKKDRGNYTGNIRLAYIQFSQGRFSDSLKSYQYLYELYPADLDVRLGIAWSYARLGNKSQAQKYFGEVLAVTRRNANALSGIEYVRKMQ